MNARRIILEVWQQHRDRPGRWGESDCLHFAADIAARILGWDPIAHLRSTYDSEIGAKRVMAQNGWESLADVCASLFPEVPVARAQAGDWIVARNADGSETIAVVIDERAIGRTMDGCALMPVAAGERAYRVRG